MDLNPTPAEQSFRDEFRAWLHSNIPESWDPSGFHDEDSRQRFEFLRAWQKKMYEAGWIGIHWPKEACHEAGATNDYGAGNDAAD